MCSFPASGSSWKSFAREGVPCKALSLDYVVMNSPFLSAAGWDAEVAKMINAFGAPIDQSDAKVIADYLKKNYGTPIASAANEKPVQLKQAAGLDKVEAQGGARHRLEYMVRNSP